MRFKGGGSVHEDVRDRKETRAMAFSLVLVYRLCRCSIFSFRAMSAIMIFPYRVPFFLALKYEFCVFISDFVSQGPCLSVYDFILFLYFAVQISLSYPNFLPCFYSKSAMSVIRVPNVFVMR